MTKYFGKYFAKYFDKIQKKGISGQFIQQNKNSF
jgi:hypothetical protein